MHESQIDLESEVARVRGELVAFRDACLPAFFAPGGIASLPWPGTGEPERLARHEWRRVADRLIAALPTGGRSGPLDPGAFAFLHLTTDPSYSIEGGRIAWGCGVVSPSWTRALADHSLVRMGIDDDLAEDPLRSLLGRLPEVERWLLGLPLDGHELPDALCTTLPLLVDADPGFVRHALDPQTWTGLVLDRPGLTPGERAEGLAHVGGYPFGNILNNALLHVMGAAADNRFGLILDLLGHPNLLGGYTDLMPHYLVAVLLAKVGSLRDMAGVVTGRETVLRLVGVDERDDLVRGAVR